MAKGYNDKKSGIYVSYGNRKLGDECITFNIPAIKYCKLCTAGCAGKCYARKAERMYKGVLEARQRNYDASLQPSFVDDMVRIIGGVSQLQGIKRGRFHESGDAYSQEYLDKLFEIARRLPDIKFLMFTKSTNLDWSEKPENIQAIFSVWPDTKPEHMAPKGSKFAFAGDCSNFEEYGFAKSMECEGHCTECNYKCWDLEGSVHFHLH